MLWGLNKTVQDKMREKSEDASNKKSYLCCRLLTSKCCKGCMFLQRRANVQTGRQLKWMSGCEILDISEEALTNRPLFEKTLTDSAPKYFKKSSFSSLLSSAGKWRTSSVLLPFVWTMSSFILLQDSRQRKSSKFTVTETSTSEQQHSGVTHHSISNTSPKRSNASW